MTSSLVWIATALLAVSTGAIAYALARVAPQARPTLGHRGLERRRAVEQSFLFFAVEPLMRYLAALLCRLLPTRPWASVEARLEQSGHHLGLTADEFAGLSFLSALSLGALGAGLSLASNSGLSWTLPGVLLGLVLPSARIGDRCRRRAKEFDKELPAAIDLAALCMGAGLDFPGAVRLVAGERSKQNVVQQELARVLEHLELGHTRRYALEALRDRVPTQAVKDFVGAVVQAEEKGNPLAEVLQIQATTLRGRRSVAAEEAASRAGVMMVIPLMLLLGCIMTVLAGPFMVNGMGL